MMYSLFLHGKMRNLRISLQNVFSAFPNSLSFATAAATVSPRDSLGLATNLAESISRKVSFKEKGNADSVVNLFTSHGFTDSQISTIIEAYPSLLIADTEKSLNPKFEFLKSRGASNTELTEILSKVPQILSMKGEKTMSRHYDVIKEIVEAADNRSKLLHSLAEGSKHENKIRNISVLREIGVPQRLLFSLLISSHPLVCGKERFQEFLKKVIDMGFDPATPKFLHALRMFYQFTDKTIQEKVNAYKKLGLIVEDVWKIFKTFPLFLTLSEKNVLESIETFLSLGLSLDEVTFMVKRFPQCITLSTELVKKKTAFVVKEMKWTVKEVILFPQVFGYSLEKRIVPRCNVIKALKSKGLLGDGDGRSVLPSMQSVLICTDLMFLKRYVRKHNDKELVSELMAIFTRRQVS